MLFYRRRRGPHDESPPSYDSLDVTLPTVLSTLTGLTPASPITPPPYLQHVPPIDLDTGGGENVNQEDTLNLGMFEQGAGSVEAVSVREQVTVLGEENARLNTEQDTTFSCHM